MLMLSVANAPRAGCLRMLSHEEFLMRERQQNGVFTVPVRLISFYFVLQYVLLSLILYLSNCYTVYMCHIIFDNLQLGKTS